MKKGKKKTETNAHKVWHFVVYELEIFKLVFLVIYIIGGGFLFASEEASLHEFSLDELEAAQLKAIQSLNEIKFNTTSLDIHTNQPCKFGNVGHLLKERAMYILHNFDLLQKNRTVEWSIGIAMYYSFVQITTIGYGDFVPVTVKGMMLTVLYSAIGIPMCISVFLRLGNLLALSLYNCWKIVKYKVRSSFKKSLHPPLYSKNPKNIRLTFLIGVNFLFIAFCACVFPYFSKLDYLDSYYFFVITMSTIGFGDIYPSRSSYSIVIFLTCFGIGLTATLFSNIRKKVQHHVETSLIAYINDITHQEGFRPYKVNQVLPSVYNKEYISKLHASKDTTSSNEELEEEEVYVVDFERCSVM